jgi:hypothetical protein
MTTVAAFSFHMVRCTNAGVFAAQVKEVDLVTGVATLQNARRIHYWAGAASLSELATKGTAKPNSCQFPVAVDEMIVREVIELIPMTDRAVASINSVPVWGYSD